MCENPNYLGNAAGFRLFMSEKDSDISICVEFEGYRWHFPAHRLVLSAMSDVFRTMLDTDMLEKSNSKIVMNDCSPITVKQFLKYLYMGIMDFNGWMEATNLLKISHKYGVMQLVLLTETYLISNISFLNVCLLHELAQIYTLKNLQRITINFIMDSAFIVSFTEGFFHLNAKSLDLVLANSKFNVETEAAVIASLREWATVECSRKGYPLTRGNILSTMEPFFKHIKWNFVPEELRTYVPKKMVEEYMRERRRRRNPFIFPPSLQYHIQILKFIVELGVYHQVKKAESSGLTCLKFNVDNHAFIVGFRIVGLFRISSMLASSPSSLILEKEGNNQIVQFNLNSLPWTKGCVVDDYVWKELVAYLPYPVRIGPFNMYNLNLRYGVRDSLSTKWPCTRLEVGVVNLDLCTTTFRCYSPCYGITQLFIMPAPPPRNVCNDIDSKPLIG